ncbi:MAG: hypothetical protein RBS92_06765, partial [Candidatus Cloacimonadales bacterium]|nr:hypothetical protein [Candidatus Cloacimonadales bacterium]
MELDKLKDSISEEIKELRGSVISNSQESEVRVDELIVQCTKLGFREELVESILLKSHFLSMAGDYETAIEKAKEGLLIAKEIDSAYLQGFGHNQCGVIYFNYCFYDKAIASFLESLSFYKSTTNYRSISNSLKNIGVAYYKKVDYILSDKYLREALICAKEHELIDIKASALSWLGILESDQKNFDLSAEYLIESKNIYLELKNYFNYAANLNIIAVSYISTNKNIAYDYLKQAVEIALKYNYVYILIDIYQNFGVIHFDRRNMM